MDPPYGIKFGSNWQVSTKKRDVKETRLEDISREPEQIKAFRDTWELGIYSYLAYLRDRLRISHELLTETGSLFLQMGDENVHLARSLLDEVFGSENFVGEILFVTTSGRASAALDLVADRLLWFAKNAEALKYRELYKPRPQHTLREQYSLIELPDGSIRRMTNEELNGSSPRSKGSQRFMPGDMSSQGSASSDSGSYIFNGKSYNIPPNTHWKTSNPDGLNRLAWAHRLYPIGNRLRYKRFADDFPIATLTNLWDDTTTSGFSSDKVYVVQTNPQVIERCILMATDPGDLVLDPTCGSGTTAYVCEEWGRRWITLDTSRVSLALTRTRLMAAKYPYYLLADSPEGIAKESELTGQAPPEYKTNNDIRKGFIYKRVPHITLKSIANNPDIKEGMSREEIDEAISRHADQEVLFDQPYADSKRIRVTGPFTVESLSPHRVLSTEVEQPASVEEAQIEGDVGLFENLVIENLLKAGVQNTRKKERLKFDVLHPHSGTWIQAVGTYTDTNDNIKQVAISIGPEHGTVGPDQVKEAAKEAVQGVGYDLLIICGYAFDPHVSEEVKRYGELNILPTRMNADLSMGDDLLKKTGAGNLFMVFGEPDVVMVTTDDGKITIEILGVDIYDPTTGEIRSSSSDDIACWFIDTSYNEESFFVRHAYFCGGNDPYSKLKKALRADIDEQAWQELYSTKSRPFDKPATGKIAIKVINHYGDEILKVYET